LVKHYTNLIKEFGGDVSKTEFCGLRNLAYPIKKNKKGHYVLLNISVKPEGITEMERQMRINEDVLRYLSIKVESLDVNPSPLMQQRNYRDEVGRRSSDEDADLV
jgi:small subunit ribosomal protein S6